MVALEQRPPSPRASALDLNRIMLYSRSGLRIGTVRGALAQRGACLADEFRPNRSNGRDRRRIAHVLETLGDAAAADGCELYRPAALARVHEAINSTRESARMRDMISSRLPGGCLSQAAAGRARMPPPEYSAQALMTDCPAA